MDRDLNDHSLTDRDLRAAFNMGFQTALYILEAAEVLSPKGRRLLVEELKKQIANGEDESPDLESRFTK